MSKHTPGPWIQAETPSGKGKVINGSGFSVCSMQGGAYCQQIIDARLIAAAPDLLEALEGLMEIESRGRVMPIGKEWDAARAAIAKAKGEQA